MTSGFAPTASTSGHVVTTLDRDGYEEDVFTIRILLRFYPDGNGRPHR